jgi:hypothetical protein
MRGIAGIVNSPFGTCGDLLQRRLSFELTRRLANAMLAGRHLPPEIARRRKKGLAYPLKAWSQLMNRGRQSSSIAAGVQR